MTTTHSESMGEVRGRRAGRPAVTDLLPLRRRLRLWRWHRTDIEAEIASHLSEVEGELRGQGLGEREAREQALARLGDLGALGDRLQAVHEGWGGGATVRRKLAMLVLAGGVALLALLCAGWWGVSTRPALGLTTLQGQLEPDDVRAVLEGLGAESERFVVDVPYPHELRLQVEQYRQGRPAQRQEQRLVRPGGAYPVLVTAQRLDNGTLRLDVRQGGTAVSWQVRTVRGWGEAVGFRTQPDLANGRRATLYCYCQKPSGSLGGAEEEPAAMARSHDLVVALTAQAAPLPAAGLEAAAAGREGGR